MWELGHKEGWALKNCYFWTVVLEQTLKSPLDCKETKPINPVCVCVCVKVAQSFPTLCNPMDYTVHGILQARMLEWVAFPFSRESSQPRDWTQVSHIAGDSLSAEPQDTHTHTHTLKDEKKNITSCSWNPTSFSIFPPTVSPYAWFLPPFSFSILLHQLTVLSFIFNNFFFTKSP